MARHCAAGPAAVPCARLLSPSLATAGCLPGPLAPRSRSCPDLAPARSAPCIALLRPALPPPLSFSLSPSLLHAAVSAMSATCRLLSRACVGRRRWGRGAGASSAGPGGRAGGVPGPARPAGISTCRSEREEEASSLLGGVKTGLQLPTGRPAEASRLTRRGRPRRLATAA